MEFLEGILASFPVIQYVLMALGSLVVVAETIVMLKPESKFSSKYDSLVEKSFIAKAFEFLESFAPIKKRKEGGLQLNNRSEDE